LKVGPYRIHNFAVPLDGGTIIHMFGLANPFLKADPDTDVKCFTALVPIKNGIISSERRVATETAKYNAIMSGTVNLRTEDLDLTVTPVVRGEVTTIVRLRGTLAAPVVDVNAAAAIAKSAASLGATVATLGGSWLADTLIRKAASDPSPCATALVQ
jgi:AsmA family protein